MNDREMDEIIDQHWRKLKSIGWPMFTSIPLYVFIAWIAVGSESSQLQPMADLSPLMVQGAALLSLLLLPLAPRLAKMIADPESSDGTPTERVGLKVTWFYIRFAISETTAIIGVILTFLTVDLFWCLTLSTVTLVYMIITRPRRSELIEAYQPNGTVVRG